MSAFLYRGALAVTRKYDKKIFELRNELLEFYEQRNHNFKNDLANTEFLSRLAYLSDIFDTLNHMNIFFKVQTETLQILSQNCKRMYGS